MKIIRRSSSSEISQVGSDKPDGVVLAAQKNIGVAAWKTETNAKPGTFFGEEERARKRPLRMNC